MIDKIFKTIKKYWYMFVVLGLTGLVIVVSFVENAKVAGLTNMIKKLADGYKAEKKVKQIELKKEQQIKKVLEDKQKTIDTLKDKTTQELADKMKEEFKL
jgi:hypothetical protein